MTKLVVGLGNPGIKYQHSFHNLGFLAVDVFVEKQKLKFKKSECKAITAETNLNGVRVIVAKPQTYMNLSGESVRELIGRYKVELKDLLIVYDDIDIERFKIRFRKEGSAGTHNGMRSIVNTLSTTEFSRLRIGVGKNPEEIPLADFVLTEIPKNWKEEYYQTLESASTAITAFLNGAPLEEIVLKHS